MKYQVRIATSEDYEKIKPIHKEVHDLHVEGRPDKYNPTKNTLDKEYYLNLVNNNEGRVYVIEYDKKIIAFTFLRKNIASDRETVVKHSYVFMEDFGVNKNYKENGLGRLLFDKALEFTEEVNATSLELGVWEFNETAIKFYEAMGMQTQARKMEIKLQKE
ncbi:GNAT family N-acetyltransferase [Halalkalibacillus halophilus]|uniref:GNAT family N-acetyltransferase n=1 Tax=Halalkalibacillus halophilus TaxID=392827 RepID=UPI0003F8DE3D|nr:GNAT family N-acetyltransferase [Halalkalibacillus halophilus]